MIINVCHKVCMNMIFFMVVPHLFYKVTYKIENSNK